LKLNNYTAAIIIYRYNRDYIGILL